LYSDDLPSFLKDVAMIPSSRSKQKVSKFFLCRNKKVRETKHDLVQRYGLKAALLFALASHTAQRKTDWKSGKASCRHPRLTPKGMLLVAAPSLNTASFAAAA